MKRKTGENGKTFLSKQRFVYVGSIALIVSLLVFFFGPKLREWRQLKKLRGLNVILITLDTLRADHVSGYGFDIVPTPALASLAEEGVLFENCIAQTPLTLPSHTTILSGTYPLHHQVRDNGGFVVPPQLLLISEILREHRFRTAAFIAAYVLHSKWGINQGFDWFDDRFDFSKYKRIALGEVRKNAATVLASARSWLAQNGRQRFFSWIHLYDAHSPYDSPSEFSKKNPGHPYRAAIAYMDSELGKFFDYLKAEGYWQNSLIIVTGDHGESLGEHQELFHGYFLYESSVRVPLIVHAPFPFPIKRIAPMVQHVDLVPTILDCLQLRTNAPLDGRSLLPLMLGKHVAGFDHAYTETYYPRLHFGWSELKAYYSGKLKYILAPQEELYDWQKDAAESQNLIFKESYERARLKAKIIALVESHARAALKPLNFKESDPEAFDKLRSLGYITSPANLTSRTLLPDPKAKIDIFHSLTQASALKDAGHVDQAIAQVQKIIVVDPDIIDAYMLLGNMYFAKKEYRKALEYYQDALLKKPDYKWQQALKQVEKYLLVFPNDATLYFEKGNIFFQRNEFDQAIAALWKAVALDPNYAGALNSLGEIYFAKKDYERADSCFRQALRTNPEMIKAQFNLALIQEEKGDNAAAMVSYRQVLAVQPQNLRAAYNLAELLRKTGRYDEALPFFKKAMEINPDFNIPYFMVAKYYADQKKDLAEAIKLCEKGVAIRPQNKYTAFGYYILADIYSYLQEPQRSKNYAEIADSIIKKVN
jgi:arylsulfatase A-like enzyme/cytochrome c-type biogenesis protein CcmH/NrfG